MIIIGAINQLTSVKLKVIILNTTQNWDKWLLRVRNEPSHFSNFVCQYSTITRAACDYSALKSRLQLALLLHLIVLNTLPFNVDFK